MPEGEKNLGGPVVKGRQNLPPLVGIGLTDLKNIGGAPAPPVPASLRYVPTSGEAAQLGCAWRNRFLLMRGTNEIKPL